VPFDPLEGWKSLRGRRWVRLAFAALAMMLVLNLVFAFLTAHREGFGLRLVIAPGFLLVAAALALVPLATNGARLWIWARFFGGTPSGGDTLRIAVASDLGAALTPTAAGAGGVRLAMLLRHGLDTARASALVALMAAEDAVFFAVFLPLAYFLGGGPGGVVGETLAQTGTRTAWVLGGGVVLGLILGFVVRRASGRSRPGLPGRALAWVREVRGALAMVLRRGKLRALGCLGLTAVQWMARYTVVAAVLAAFGIRAAVLPHVLLQWVVFTAGTVVPTPGGAAAIETAFALVYQPFVPAALLGPITAVWRFTVFYFVLIVDVLVLARHAVGLARDESPCRAGILAR
jgi:uncharacterized membrane protein YbhN (UPF0104 family)